MTEEQMEARKELIRISDRKHWAWDKVKEFIDQYESQGA